MNPAHLSFVDVFKVGVKEIDDQHNQLLVLVNDLNEAAKFSVTEDMYNTMASEVTNFAAHHFLTEERYMDMLPPGEEDVEQHKKMHVELFNTLNRSTGSDPTTAANELVAFIRRWLVNHIMQHDILLGKKLNAIGVF